MQKFLHQSCTCGRVIKQKPLKQLVQISFYCAWCELKTWKNMLNFLPFYMNKIYCKYLLKEKKMNETCVWWE